VNFSPKTFADCHCGSYKRGILCWVTDSVAVLLCKQMPTLSALGGIAHTIGGSTASNAATVANRTKGLNWGMQVENESGGDMKTSIVWSSC
jgi:hypothetical protein